MAHYTDEDARRVFNQDINEVHAAYAEQAQRQRPERERARNALLGRSAPEPTITAPVIDEDPEPDEQELDPGEVEG